MRAFLEICLPLVKIYVVAHQRFRTTAPRDMGGLQCDLRSWIVALVVLLSEPLPRTKFDTRARSAEIVRGSIQVQGQQRVVAQ